MVDLLGNEVRQRAPRGTVPRWADRYGYSVRAVKQFLAIGRKLNDPPPFDDPRKMEAWAERALPSVTKRFREGVLKALEGSDQDPAAQQSDPDAGPSGSSASAASSSSAVGGKSETQGIVMPDVSDSELGIEQQLKSYRVEFAQLGKLRAEALATGNFSRANSYFEQQQQISSEIRQLEKILPSILEQRGEWMKSAEVKIETMGMLNILKRTLLGRGAKAAHRLRSAATDDELIEAWKDEINTAFAEVTAARFEERFELNETPASL